MAATLDHKFDGHIQCPNSAPSDSITVEITFEDKAGVTGVFTAVGPYGGFNEIDAANDISIDGNPMSNRTTSLGDIVFTVNFNAGFDFENVLVSCMKVTDHLGFASVETADGQWNVIMANKSTKYQQVPLVTETGEYLIYQK